MGKKLTINFEKNEYTLEYNRRIVAMLEDKGINQQAIYEKPVKTIPALFAGAFYMHHKNLNGDLIERIYESISDKEGFLQALITMFLEPMESIFEEPATEGNASWEKGW
jgi:hypothetical protein